MRLAPVIAGIVGGTREQQSRTLGYYAELLKRITDSAFNEGEHAE